MSYLSIVNSFWDSATVKPLPTEQIALYMALLHVCNGNGWAEWFQASNQVLSVLTGLSVSRIEKAREGLEERNLIEFSKRCNKSGLYRIIAAGDL